MPKIKENSDEAVNFGFSGKNESDNKEITLHTSPNQTHILKRSDVDRIKEGRENSNTSPTVILRQRIKEQIKNKTFIEIENDQVKNNHAEELNFEGI